MDVLPIEAGVVADQFITKRHELGLTQAELAKQAGVSRHLISDAENGRCASITLGNLAKIAHQLGLSIRLTPGIPLLESQRTSKPDENIDALLNKYYRGI